ncbi:GNAT family N-acetyltransferase [Cellulomonas chengniuliangii]|uniref:GNAT family N-acetyltransferase n=1 Tax=Cellulomonas chengniuliangii TaxID=2968084 RepID=A0ABY5L025_9CELL|nr:GNAT family N-acetyltransferase [Cellulomonas chengniuliangii]MCC2309698.1 GNAT family N-acetyltransferase [Cellulomonas chengniuliangii]MCC2318994.1 GNAT family N-acetyltransferase [Cellulomonas chengniuliangii]UUI74755.1 GNAT family N-acetyltransferase [Cellulomonas chengniuliangii]
MFVRSYEPFDRQDVYDVCVRTGAAGADARGVYSDDDLLPDVYAGPYLHLEPELAFVLDDGDRAVGYVLGTADTQAWAAAYRRHWLPLVAARRARVEAPVTPEEHLVEQLHHPEWNVRDVLADYPAHLHIDLLPEHQGAGHGRELMRVFLAALAERGVGAVHLGVSNQNVGAQRFYARLGFHRIDAASDTDVTFLGRATDVPV